MFTFQLEVDTTDSFVHCVQLFDEIKTADRVLIQLFVRIRVLAFECLCLILNSNSI